MSKKHYCDNTHLTLDQRKIIETGIRNRSSKIAIAETIGKDASTIAKEIRLHRTLKSRNLQRYPVDCKFLKVCRNGCQVKCDVFQKATCTQRDRTPGACNGCPKVYSCQLDKYYYSAERAFNEYRYDLVDSRQGINLTTSEASKLATIIDPLIQQGQSVYQILSAHPEIDLCEKTIYNYIDMGVFKSKNIDLKEKVQRREIKKKYKKRKEPANYEGRKYSDFLKFLQDNPNCCPVEMDTVHNSPSGPYIQTLFLHPGVMIGYIHQQKTSESMATTFDYLQECLSADVFISLFSLILADRGTEFQKYELFEFSMKTGEARLNIFYCDAMASSQKANVENNHNYLRDIIPNNVSLDKITNEDLQLVFSHINCTPRKSLNGKSPYEIFSFIYSTETDPDFGRKILSSLGINEIPRDDVILKPYLLKK